MQSETPELFPSCWRLVLQQQDEATGTSGDGVLGKALPPCGFWRLPLGSPLSTAMGES